MVGVYLEMKGGRASNIYAEVDSGVGVQIVNTHDTVITGIRSFAGINEDIKKAAGRNDTCPCGSGKKYKKCHLGKSMSTAIKSSNSSTTFKDTLAVSSGDGIVLDNDRSSFEGTKIFAGVSEESINSIITRLGLPDNTPPELVLEAIGEISATGNVSIVERSRLKSWLSSAANFDIAGWTSVALAIASIAVQK